MPKSKFTTMQLHSHYLKQTRKVIVLFALLLGWMLPDSIAQSGPVISYPTAAGNLITGYSNSNLTVKLSFSANCNGTVRIGLPPSITYAGSVAKIGGTAGVNIAHSGGTASSPEFAITGVSGAGDEITFTVSRKADCGTAASGKDSVFFTSSGGCSNSSETSASTNLYTVFSPSLSFTATTPISNTVIGANITRTVTITNGGNGALDTLRFYIVYPSGSMENTNSNKITIGSTDFSPYTTNGDTLFYEIFGNTIFGGDAILAASESVSISEPVKVKKCNISTIYGSSWGRNRGNICQKVTISSPVTMATGAASLNPVINTTNIGYVDKCTPFDVTMEYNNNGTGNSIAAGMYDIRLRVGSHYSSTNSLLPVDTNLIMFTNARINGAAITAANVYWDGNYHFNIELNDYFTSDPDGAGVGLDDLDGDGFFDDLEAGKTVTLRFTFAFKCHNTCGQNKGHQYTGGTIDFHRMCDNKTSSRTASGNANTSKHYIYENAFDGVGYMPANVMSGVPFRFQAKEAHYQNSSDFDNVQTRYRWKIALPTGFSPSGTPNARYGTSPASYILIPGMGGIDTIQFTSSSNLLDSFSINLVLSCGSGAGGDVALYYSLEKLDNISTGCFCGGKLFCDSLTTRAFCPGPCSTGGPTTYIPKIRRADGSLGWTNYTLSTRQLASNITDYDLSKALYLDTIIVQCSGRQNAANNNLYFKLLLDKATGGYNKLLPIKTITKFYRGGSLIYTYTGSDTSSAESTPTMQSITFNLTSAVSALPGGSLLANDSFYSEAYYVVSTNNGLPRNDIQSGHSVYYYNLDNLGTKLFCNVPVPEMYLVGTDVLNGTNAYNVIGCTPNDLGGNGNNIARRFNSSGQNYTNEFRPVLYVDSMVLIKPTGYDLLKVTYTPNTGGTDIDPLTPTYISGNKYVYVNPNDGTWAPPRLTVTNSYGLSSIMRVVANCAAQDGEQITFKVFVRDFYYAYAGQPTPPGLAYELFYPNNGNNNGLVKPIQYLNTSKPDISLVNLTGAIQGVSPQHYWDLRLSNPSLQTAPYNWIAIPNHSGISVASVVDLSTMTTISPISYSGGVWYQLSTAGIASAATKDYRITFNYTSCNADSLKVFGGWNCNSYPTDPSTYTCGKDSVFLKINPAPSQIQLSILRQPGGGSPKAMCTEDSVKIVVQSSQASNLVNPYLTFYPPNGITLVSPVLVEYPMGSGNYQNASVTPVGAGYMIDLSAHSAIGSNGILGTVLANPANSGNDRKAVVTVKYMTDCSFSSGQTFTFNGYGKKACGDNALDNGTYVSTSGLTITGATTTGGAGVALSFNNTSVSCNTSRTLTSTITPLLVGSNATDTVVYLLPSGLAFAGNVSPGSISATVIGNIVKVAMPLTAANTPTVFSFDVIASGQGCGGAMVNASYKRMITGQFCGATPCSNSSIILESVMSPTITIQKPDLEIKSVMVTTGNYSVGTSYTADIKIANHGAVAAPASTYYIEAFYDTATIPFQSLLISPMIASNDSATSSFNFTIPNSYPNSNKITYKIRPATYSNGTQCLCDSNLFLSDQSCGTISGTPTVCVGATTTLVSHSTPNGATPWSSSNTSVATVSASGVVTGVSVGTATITFTDVDNCAKGLLVTVQGVTVNAGQDISICQVDTAFATAFVNGASADPGVTNLVWSTYNGTGVFANNTTATALSTTTYKATTADHNAAQPGANLVLTATGSNGCVASDTMRLDIRTTYTWKGGVSEDFGTAANWLLNCVPPQYAHINFASTVLNICKLDQHRYLTNITNDSNATAATNILDLNGKRLTVVGQLSFPTAATTGKINAEDGLDTMEFRGASPYYATAFNQVIPNNVFTNKTVSNLRFDNGAGVTEQDSIYITHTLQPMLGNYYSGEMLTLRSTRNLTARVTPITNTSTTMITGKVVIERFIPGDSNRAWRILSAGIQASPTAQTIFQSWQENMRAMTGSNYQVGYGTFVSRPFAGIYNGYDSSSHNPSLKYWDGTQLVVPFSTSLPTTDKITDNGGVWFLFVRGDKTIRPEHYLSPTIPYNGYTTLRQTGILNQGAVTVGQAGTNFSLIPNPYASPIDLDAVGLVNGLTTFYVWDSKLNTIGGYRTLTKVDGNYIATPSTGDNTDDNNLRYLQSGQGFFIPANKQLNFTEDMKADNLFTYSVYKTTTLQKELVAELHNVTNASAPYQVDGFRIYIDSSYSNSYVANEDVLKAVNVSECLAVAVDTQRVVINKRQAPLATDTIQLKFWQTTLSSYKLSFTSNNFGNNMTASLIDQYTNTVTPLSNTSTTDYNFTVTSATGSWNINRFIITLTSTNPLSMTDIRLSAEKRAEGARLQWQANSQKEVSHYDVERSEDGKEFRKIQTIARLGDIAAHSYTWTDVLPIEKTAYYRIKGVSASTEYVYSNVAQLHAGNGIGSISVYPNPVTSQSFNVILSHIAKGNYTVALYTEQGQLVETRMVQHAGATVDYPITLQNTMAAGTYMLKLMDGSTVLHTQRVIIKK